MTAAVSVGAWTATPRPETRISQAPVTGFSSSAASMRAEAGWASRPIPACSFAAERSSSMLVLSRKRGQSIAIGDQIVITVVRLGRGNVQIGIEVARTCADLATGNCRALDRQRRNGRLPLGGQYRSVGSALAGGVSVAPPSRVVPRENVRAVFRYDVERWKWTCRQRPSRFCQRRVSSCRLTRGLPAASSDCTRRT